VKRFLVWLFTDALSVRVGSVRYVPDWVAIGAVLTALLVVVSVVGIWYAMRAGRQERRHQRDMEAKHVEKELLVRVMDQANMPYESAMDFLYDIVAANMNDATKTHQVAIDGIRKAREVHRQFSTATASLMNVLRRSRPRRFPRKTRDQALEHYDDLVQKAVAVNGRLLRYITACDWSKIDVEELQREGGGEAFEMGDILRRVTADLLARMYSDEHEWIPFRFEGKPEDGDGRVAFDFVDDPPLGTP